MYMCICIYIARPASDACRTNSILVSYACIYLNMYMYKHIHI